MRAKTGNAGYSCFRTERAYRTFGRGRQGTLQGWDVASQDRKASLQGWDVASQDRKVTSQDRKVALQDRDVTSQDRGVTSQDRGVTLQDRDVTSQDRKVASQDRDAGSHDGVVALTEDRNDTYRKSGSGFRCRKPDPQKGRVAGRPRDRFCSGFISFCLSWRCCSSRCRAFERWRRAGRPCG